MSELHTDQEKVTTGEAHSPPSGSPDVREEAISPLTADRRPQSPPAEEEAEEEGSCPLGVEGSEESGGRGDGGRVGEGEGSLRAGEDTTMSGDHSDDQGKRAQHQLDRPGDSTEAPADRDGDVDTNTDPSVDANTDPNVDANTDPNVDTNTDPSVDTSTDPNVDADTDPNVDTSTDPKVDANTDPIVDTSTDPNVDTNTDPKVDANTDPKVDANTNPNVDANTDPDAGEEVDAVANTRAETNAVGDTDATNGETITVRDTEGDTNTEVVDGTDVTNGETNAPGDTSNTVGDTDVTGGEPNAIGDSTASTVVDTDAKTVGDANAVGDTDTNAVGDTDANAVGDTDTNAVGDTDANAVGDTDANAVGDADPNAEIDADSDTLSEDGSSDAVPNEGEGDDAVPLARERRRRRQGSANSELESGEEGGERSGQGHITSEGWEEEGGAGEEEGGGGAGGEGWEEGGGAGEEEGGGGAGGESWEEGGGAGGEGWVEAEEEEGGKEGEKEGEEEKKEDSPMFVPTRGKFFQHDTRYTAGEAEEKEEPTQTIITRADRVDRWQHDLYVAEEQKPKEQWEKERDSKMQEALEQRKAQRGPRRGGATLGNWLPREEGGRGQREPRRGWGRGPRDQRERREGDWDADQGTRRSRERPSWSRRDREDGHARPPRENRRQRGGRRSDGDDRAHGKWTDESRSKPPGEAAATAAAVDVDVGTSGWGPVVPDTQWNLEEEEDSVSNRKSGDAERKKSVSPVAEKAVAKTEDTKRSSHPSSQSGSGSSSGQPLQSGSSQPSAHQTKVFSLNLESKLQVKSEDNKRGRGKGKGRGWREKLGAPKVGAADSPTGSGITVIEPLEKRLSSEQTEDGQEGYIPPGHRLAGGVQKPEQETRPSEGRTQAESVEGEQEGQGSLAQASKPKRYSSRRQKMDPAVEEQPQGSAREKPPPGTAAPWVTTGGGYMDPTSAAMYQEMIAQQMKAMANSGNIPPAAGLSPMQLQPNPLMMQWLWYIQQQQAAYQQQQQQSLLQMEAGPGRAPLHQGPPPPPRGPEMMNYPQAPLQSVPVPGAVDQEGLKQGFTSPGLFIPPMAPEQQRRHQQQMLSKPKSQAIPILPPKDENSQAQL